MTQAEHCRCPTGNGLYFCNGLAVCRHLPQYAGAQMLSDIASLKIGLVGGFAVDMGTFIYPITFTRDVVHAPSYWANGTPRR